MIHQIGSKNGFSFQQVLQQNWVGFCLNTGKRFFLEVSFSSQQKEDGSSKKRYFLKKLEYGFLVERTKIEKASFPYKTAISEANVKTNRMVSTK